MYEEGQPHDGAREKASGLPKVSNDKMSNQSIQSIDVNVPQTEPKQWTNLNKVTEFTAI